MKEEIKERPRIVFFHKPNHLICETDLDSCNQNLSFLEGVVSTIRVRKIDISYHWYRVSNSIDVISIIYVVHFFIMSSHLIE